VFDKATIASLDTLAPPPPPSSGESVAPDVAVDDMFDDPDLPGFTITDPDAPMPKASAPREREGAGGRAGGHERGRGRGRGRARQDGPQDKRQSTGGSTGLPSTVAKGTAREGDRGGRRFDNRDGRGRGRQGSAQRNDRSADTGGISRISKSTPIRDVVKEGQTIIVQITKEPISTKGARCSSHISLPGRYVVYLPTVEHIGVSKRIGSERERARLRESIEGMKPPTGGLIVRTVAEGLTKKQLKQDVGYLVRLWGEIAKTREGAKAPATLMSELDIVLKTARDLFTDEVDKLVIDDRNQYQRILSFVEMFMPERIKDIELYEGDEPIFDAYGIEDEIQRALSRKVPLASGGYLVIDQAEALTAIDVNTGRYVGKGAKDMEEAIVRTNLEAVEEIAYQLRFRNIGGMIILDLIDMEKASSREKIRKRLEELLQKDKAKTTLNRISDLGLIEMTRKRTRESLGRLLHEPCFYCDGTGQLQSKETIAYEILREIRRKRRDLPGYSIHLNCHPAVADIFAGAEKAALQDAENRYMRKIHVNPRREYHLEQFDLVGK
jgi:ribonuclease G